MLTDKKVKSLKPKTSPYYERDNTGRRGIGTLVVQVLPSGTKTYSFQYYKDGKAKFIKIGNAATHSLSDARKAATEFSRLVVDGIDPKKEIKKKEAEDLEQELLKAEMLNLGSLGNLIDDYTSSMRENGKRTFAQVKHALDKEFKALLNEPAYKITSDDIMNVLSNMISRGAVVQSNRVRSYIMTAFNFGIKYEFDPMYMSRRKRYSLSVNPVQNIPRQAAAEKVRERSLDEVEMRLLFSSLGLGGFSRTTQILISLLFVTGGQRPFELIASKWSHFDLERKIWDMPSEISKNKKAHVIPLVDTAVSLLIELKSICGESEFLFPKRGTESEHIPTTSLAQSIRRFCDVTQLERFQPKDIRRTCKTIMGELGIDKFTRDRLQNHALQDVSAKHYDRYDYLKEKKEALVLWEKYLMNLISVNCHYVN